MREPRSTRGANGSVGCSAATPDRPPPRPAPTPRPPVPTGRTLGLRSVTSRGPGPVVETRAVRGPRVSGIDVKSTALDPERCGCAPSSANGEPDTVGHPLAERVGDGCGRSTLIGCTRRVPAFADGGSDGDRRRGHRLSATELILITSPSGTSPRHRVHERRSAPSRVVPGRDVPEPVARRGEGASTATVVAALGGTSSRRRSCRRARLDLGDAARRRADGPPRYLHR